jgi:LuxR family maltose regulon positive regulatory protein
MADDVAQHARRLLLAVKQMIPPVRPGAVRRPHLERQLRSAGTELTTVVAPAGWGKTSLLSAWANDPDDDIRIAWVSLDEGDDEPNQFWQYLLSALRGVSPDLSDASLEALAGRGSDPMDIAVPTLLNELAAGTARHVVVLDDFHLLSDPGIHESVEFLISYLPPSLRLVIAGRVDPPLPLARMRARGQLTELRAADLRLSVDEARALLSNVSGVAVGESEVTAVWERTEGWAAGLQLAGLARRARGSVASTRVGDDRHVLDYITAEVLPALTPDQRDLLVRTTALERLSGSLCDAALRRTGSATLLAELDRADLFLVALDDDREWYRCHRLLRDVLLREGVETAESRREVLRRAADWFEQHEQLDEAVRHLMMADEPAPAATLLGRSRSWFWERGAGATYLRLGEQLPRAEVAPHIAVDLAYAAALNGHRDRVTHWLDLADEHIEPDTVIPGWSSAHAAVLTLRGLIGTAEAGTGDAVELCRQAVLLETERGDAYRIALGSLGGALALDAQFAEAADVLAELWRHHDEIAWTSGVRVQIGGTLAWSLVELDRADDADRVLREAGALADQAERQWGRATAGPFMAILRITQGRRELARGDPTTARTTLAAAVPLAESTNRMTIVALSLVHLAAAELGCGDRAAARITLARAGEIVADEPVSPFARRMVVEAQNRVGRIAARSARRAGVLIEELTDRELSILRLLPGPASQREIGRALYLSINTVKAYTKGLYRKLGVASRQEAVAAARDLGLI